MRVLMVSSLWPPTVLGGAEIYAADLARHLEQAGHEVGALTLGADGPEVVEAVRAWPYRLNEFEQQPAWRRRVFHLIDVYNPVAASAMTKTLRSFRPDVVHSHAVQGLSMAVLSAPARYGVPHVHTVHDYWLLCQRASMVQRSGESCETRCRPCRAISGVREQFARRHFADVVVAPSQAIADEHAAFGPAAARMKVVLHPLDAPGPPRPARGEQPTTFGFIGQLARTKGVATLLDAFERLPAGTARLLVAGRGAMAAEIETRAVPGVQALGWLDGDGKERFFADVDAIVVPSEWKEPAPLVINEAKARRIPVIGASIGGIPELVPVSSRPLLFRSGDTADLERSLNALMKNPSEFEVAPVHWGWDEHINAIVETYREAGAKN
jgi:glycosyltransferase involved in cell wall biosynthesis